MGNGLRYYISFLGNPDTLAIECLGHFVYSAPAYSTSPTLNATVEEQTDGRSAVLSLIKDQNVKFVKFDGRF